METKRGRSVQLAATVNPNRNQGKVNEGRTRGLSRGVESRYLSQLASVRALMTFLEEKATSLFSGERHVFPCLEQAEERLRKKVGACRASAWASFSMPRNGVFYSLRCKGQSLLDGNCWKEIKNDLASLSVIPSLAESAVPLPEPWPPLSVSIWAPTPQKWRRWRSPGRTPLRSRANFLFFFP